VGFLVTNLTRPAERVSKFYRLFSGSGVVGRRVRIVALDG